MYVIGEVLQKLVRSGEQKGQYKYVYMYEQKTLLTLLWICFLHLVI
jgi:hypothetical protein